MVNSCPKRNSLDAKDYGQALLIQLGILTLKRVTKDTGCSEQSSILYDSTTLTRMVRHYIPR